jgi:hypothetical protein
MLPCTCASVVPRSTWPSRPAFLAAFTSLASISLHGPAISCSQQRTEAITPLLLSLASLPKLQDLALTHAGPGSLENIDVLTALTSLAVIRPNDGTFANRSSTADGEEQDGNVDADADADAAAAAGAGAAGGVPNWVLPGAVDDADDIPFLADAPAEDGAAAAGGGGYAAMAAAAAAAAAAGDAAVLGARSSSSSSSSSSSGDDARLPKSMAKLCKLRQLLLESIVPEFAVLAQMQELKRLELRVRNVGVVHVLHNMLLTCCSLLLDYVCYGC